MITSGKHSLVFEVEINYPCLKDKSAHLLSMKGQSEEATSLSAQSTLFITKMRFNDSSKTDDLHFFTLQKEKAKFRFIHRGCVFCTGFALLWWLEYGKSAN